MKKTTFFVILINLCMTLTGYAQRNRLMLSDLISSGKKSTLLKPLSTPATGSEVTSTHYPLILELDPQHANDVLDELGAVVYYHREHMYLTSIPIENLDLLPRMAGIDSYQVSALCSSNLDMARPLTRIDCVQKRLGTIQKIDVDHQHKVVTGICDVGFDPRHQAFRNCLKRWVTYDEYHGIRNEYDGYSTIINQAPLTDTPQKTHATHVGGIIAGYSNDNPYYGVAPASDFVATTSQLTEVGILAGIEDVIEYAKSKGLPAVVNISAGSYLGPHDGKDLVGRYLTALSQDAVICFSAGNYGQRNNCQRLTLNIEDKPMGSGWCDMTWLGFNVAGGTDIWSADTTPVEFRLVVWDQDDMEYKYVTEWMAGDGNEGEYYLDLEDNPWFNSGGVWCAWGTAAENGRWNAAFEYDYSSDAIKTGQVWARYVVAYQIRAVRNNTHVDVYADGIRSFLHGFTVPDCMNGTSDGSISNLACCPDVIAVGAWNSRSKIPDVTDGTRNLEFDVNCIAPWSAYGFSGDGRRLPHISAPGNVVVSAMSSPHSTSDFAGLDDSEFIAYQFQEYKYFAAAGTSMSSPLAAGVFALWLEANPTLTVHDIQEIATRTARRDFADIDNPRWGAGALDALAGLDYISSVGTLSSDKTICPPVVNIRDGRVHIDWPGVTNYDVHVTDLSGRRVNPETLQPSTIYLISVYDKGSSTSYNFKMM